MTKDTQLLRDVAEEFCRSRGYLVETVAGEGAFKLTFRARSVSSGLVAVKVVAVGSMGERLERELRAMQRCDHPSIVPLLEAEVRMVSGRRILVICEPFLGGGSLSDILAQKGNVSASECHAVARSLGSALGHLAAHDLVHRDIKPDNIMFGTGSQTPILVDLGLVRDLADHSLTQSWLHQGPGTPLFAAPEQLLNEKGLIDWRTDQFGLGVTLSFAVFGQHPFQEPGMTVSEAVASVAQRRDPSAAWSARCRTEGFGYMEKMVAPWPIARYRTASQMLDAIPL